MDNIKRLETLLQTDSDGQEIAGLLNELLVNSKKRTILLLRLHEIGREILTLRSEVRLTKLEEVARDIVLGVKKPITAEEVSERAEGKYRSLRHPSHTSTILNSLVSKGILGKIRIAGRVYFTTPREAVMGQLKTRGETPQECSPLEIVGTTGVPLAVVLEIIYELQG